MLSSPVSSAPAFAAPPAGGTCPLAAPDATRLSGSAAFAAIVAPLRRAAAASWRTLGGLARSSLTASIAMSSSACLVAAPPEYDEPQQTAPLLIASEAFPDIRQILVVQNQNRVEFGGAVLSQDNGAAVQLRLYVDYGQLNLNDFPFREAIGLPEIPPGTFQDGPRKFQGRSWLPHETGCHSITMMASHSFDFRACPTSIDDSSYLVWQVMVCDENGCPDVCEPPPCAAQQCPSCATPTTDAGVSGGAL